MKEMERTICRHLNFKCLVLALAMIGSVCSSAQPRYEVWSFHIKRDLLRRDFHYPIMDTLNLSNSVINNDTLTISIQNEYYYLMLKSDSVKIEDNVSMRIHKFSKVQFNYAVIMNSIDNYNFSIILIVSSYNTFIFKRKKTLTNKFTLSDVITLY